MNARGAALPTDDCFERFDEAFARLEADLESSAATVTVTPSEPPPTAPAADLSDFEEAFNNIDRHLGAASPVPAGGTTRGNLALVPPSAALAEPAPAAALPEPARPAALASPVEELWRHAGGGGTPLERLVQTMQNLLWLQRAINTRSARVADRVTFEEVSGVFADARQLCVDFDLPTARVRADFALTTLEGDRLDSLAAEIGELVRHIRHDLQSCSIWPIPKGRVWAFSLALGERAQRAFPSAVADVAEGGRCAGFGFHSASVFHMLRAAGYGMRALAVAARGKGAGTGAPTWPSTIVMVEARLAEVRRWPASGSKAAATAFYTAVLHDARTLHDADCRVASGGTFDEHHTLAIVHGARALLTRLADHVTEQQELPLTKKEFGGNLTSRA